ncbi:MAG: protein arginine kinase [Planctomycetes bacterium]|nr:protein arginine kinase [Planctomycetota bacterium]
MDFQAQDLHKLARSPGAWMCVPGPDSDVAVSCRVRLARNLEGFPFVTRLDEARAQQLCSQVQSELVEIAIDGETRFVHLPEAPPLLRLMLRERHLASRDLSPSEDGSHGLPGRAVAFGSSETTAVMVNEEDHLRLQALAGGFQLELAWSRAVELDQQLERRLSLAFTRELGYLTACPTNVGTGLRASVMLHLPALALVRSEIEKVFAAAQRTGLAVRGLYGEGSRAVGDFYQISNQITLGRSETQLVSDLKALAARVIEYERKLRTILFEEQKAALKDRVSRSLGLLRTARAMPTEGALAHLSNVRLGVYLGLVRELPLESLNALTVQVQKAHIQALSSPEPALELAETSERDRLRAAWLRQRLAERDA